MKAKYPAHVMVFGVVSSEGDVMLPYFFEEGLKVNSDVYTKAMHSKPTCSPGSAGLP